MNAQFECKRVIKWSAISHTMERRSVGDTTRGMQVVLGTRRCVFVRNVIEALAPIHGLLIPDTLQGDARATIDGAVMRRTSVSGK